MTTYTNSAGQKQEAIGIFDAANTAAGVVIDRTPTLDTSVHVAGKVLIAPTILPGALSAANRVSLWQSLQFVDKSNTGPTVELMLFDSNPTSFGAVNTVMALSDADALKEVGSLLIATTDWKARPNNKAFNPKNIGLEFTAAAADIYYAAWVPTGGTGGTFGASDFFLRFGFVQG